MSAENSLSLNQVREIVRTGTFDKPKATPIDGRTFDKLEVTILDVRTVEEFKGGRIDNAINVPVAELEQALDLAPALFEKKYGSNLPKHDSKTEALLVYCMSGMRTRKAIGILSGRGYKDNLYAYFGGWAEYSKPTTN
ncbi:hypothetical protein GGI01_000218 [Coemansia sp. RSA 376]|nr:hypothetical protein GGI01_000218 [Coemansia sp. RSA 376]KAJ2341534.1 hypothetical protein GGH92_005770 [Coemansia sp. RSA 2673]KAJ2428142.1 hypothetical protein GGF41_001461 [Coemansia sp. RSA 2531]KAJ2457439.1 hypothetical protein GGI03_006100 [Coemansia sp. RSA 2337]